MKRRAKGHGLGSYDRQFDYVEARLDELLSVEARGQASLSRAWDAVETGSASRAFKAKQDTQTALAALTRALVQARTAEATFGRALDSLPGHSPFEKAHHLMRDFRLEIERAERLRKRLIKASYGDITRLREGLSSHDPRRSRLRRRRRR